MPSSLPLASIIRFPETGEIALGAGLIVALWCVGAAVWIDDIIERFQLDISGETT